MNLIICETHTITKVCILQKKSFWHKMFSSIFGKQKPPVVIQEGPPIPGPRNEDSFVIVNPTPPPANIYPNVSGGTGAPTYFRAAPVPPIPRVTQPEVVFHYLQGVPFQLSRQLQMATNKDTMTSEIADMLAFLTNQIRVNNVDYDFSVEKSVLKEC